MYQECLPHKRRFWKRKRQSTKINLFYMLIPAKFGRNQISHFFGSKTGLFPSKTILLEGFRLFEKRISHFTGEFHQMALDIWDHSRGGKLLGPVVQSIVSLTSSLRGQLVKCFRTL